VVMDGANLSGIVTERDLVNLVAEGVNTLLGPNMGALVITHYQRLLNYIKPHVVSIMYDGRIVLTGGPELALELEEGGYESIRKRLGLPSVAEPA